MSSYGAHFLSFSTPIHSFTLSFSLSIYLSRMLCVYLKLRMMTHRIRRTKPNRACTKALFSTSIQRSVQQQYKLQHYYDAANSIPYGSNYVRICSALIAISRIETNEEHNWIHISTSSFSLNVGWHLLLFSDDVFVCLSARYRFFRLFLPPHLDLLLSPHLIMWWLKFHTDKHVYAFFLYSLHSNISPI